MRILVLQSQTPFTRGGAEVLAEGLVNALNQRGHQADVVTVPFKWYPPERLFDSAIAWRMLDLSEVNGSRVDAVVCTKYPTWAAKHPNKVLWLVHQHRQAYDLYGSQYSDFGPGAEDRRTRERVIDVDRRGINECQARFAISENVAKRLREFNGIEATSLYPPVQDRDLWPERYDPFILSVARLDALKRVDALIEAWPMVDTAFSLKITSDGPSRDLLERRVRELGIGDRVEFLGRVSDERLAQLFRRCRAVYYAPIDEDYGYTAVEGLTAGKPVITAADSGGVLEFVREGVTGTISPLDPVSLSSAINTYLDVELAKLHGARGQAATAGITWENVIRSLFGPEA
jgi:glycosyltransferase involved in cell wall biosynthesis